jgi:hypothetical protein
VKRKKLMLKRLVILLAVLPMQTACQWTKTTSGDTAIEAVCREWGRSLPTRSKQDTEQTQREIGRAYNIFQAVCKQAVP